jgi:hypothetical protein
MIVCIHKHHRAVIVGGVSVMARRNLMDLRNHTKKKVSQLDRSYLAEIIAFERRNTFARARDYYRVVLFKHIVKFAHSVQKESTTNISIFC